MYNISIYILISFILYVLIVLTSIFYKSTLSIVWLEGDGFVVLMSVLPLFIAYIYSLKNIKFLKIPNKKINLKLLKAIYYILILIEFSYYLLNNSYDINNARYEIALPFLHTIVLILAVTTFVAKDSFDFNKAITLIYCIFLGLRSMLFIYLFIIFGTLIYKAKSILKKFFLIIIPLVILVCLGEYRQPDEFNIIEFSGYSINSKFIAWILAYTTINIDNLLLAYHEDYNSKYFLPVATFGYIFSFFDSGARMEMGRLENELIYVGRLNLGTAFRSFYFDFGVIFGSIICSLVLCFYVRIMKISEIHENYAVLMLSLTPFYLYSVLNFISAPFILIPLLFYYVVYRKNYTTIN